MTAPAPLSAPLNRGPANIAAVLGLIGGFTGAAASIWTLVLLLRDNYDGYGDGYFWYPFAAVVVTLVAFALMLFSGRLLSNDAGPQTAAATAFLSGAAAGFQLPFLDVAPDGSFIFRSVLQATTILLLSVAGYLAIAAIRRATARAAGAPSPAFGQPGFGPGPAQPQYQPHDQPSVARPQYQPQDQPSITRPQYEPQDPPSVPQPSASQAPQPQHQPQDAASAARPQASALAPGWYEDGSGSHVRWWDGSGWTEHTQPVQR